MIDSKNIRDFQDTLFNGNYNLLLGSGISITSLNKNGERLRSAEELRTDLCKLTGSRPSTNLQRVYSLLTPYQIKTEITDKYSGCTPSSDILPLSKYLWRKIFSFNVDDVIESVYDQSKHQKQKLISLNYDSDFEPSTEKAVLHLIHLHGYVGKPENGFVFSHAEYARIMSTNNYWMHMLSQIIGSEPFVIAGTSLNEIDLEYYLSFRTRFTPRKGRGPSFLIEPHPDVATESDCRRYGLTLLPVTFDKFIQWLYSQYPTSPTVKSLIAPDVETIFTQKPDSIKILKFFSNYELVGGSVHETDYMPTPFFYGVEPNWEDIFQHKDIERSDNGTILSIAKNMQSKRKDYNNIVLMGEAGSGKSTILKRVAKDLSSEGNIVLYVKAIEGLDVSNSISCMKKLDGNIYLVVDNMADHAEQILEIISSDELKGKIVVISGERNYRYEHINTVFLDVPHKRLPVTTLKNVELGQLIEQYQKYGLIGSRNLLKNKDRFIKYLQNDPIAVAICRIMNDFRPLNRIVDSLWRTAKGRYRKTYTCCALAKYCHTTGVKYSILQEIEGVNSSISSHLDVNKPLPLAVNPLNDDYIVPRSEVLSREILLRVAKTDRKLLLSSFIALSNSLSPYVNRPAIKKRSPEARLAGRLFDVDKVVSPLLNEDAEKFFVSTKGRWEWNSRYWEQRALLISNTDINTALQYARHAVATETHPYPLTTLGKILLMHVNKDNRDSEDSFTEAFGVLVSAIRITHRERGGLHPFVTLINGAAKYISIGGKLSEKQKRTIEELVDTASYKYGNDPLIKDAITRYKVVS